MAKKTKTKTTSTRAGYDPRDILITVLVCALCNGCDMPIEHACLLKCLAAIVRSFLFPPLQPRIASTVADGEHDHRAVTERKLKSKLQLGGPGMNRNLRKIVWAIIIGIVREVLWSAVKEWFDDDDPPPAPGRYRTQIRDSP